MVRKMPIVNQEAIYKALESSSSINTLNVQLQMEKLPVKEIQKLAECLR